MAEDKIQAIIRFVKDLKTGDLTERARKERFIALLQELFPEESREIARLTMGAESSVQIRGTERLSRGAMDTFYGDLIIEFERKLPAKISEAERQLREYCSGVWNDEAKPKNYICIATDGVEWQTYFPRTEKAKPYTPEDIELEPREKVTLEPTRESANAFYYWLSRIFFREGILKPTVADFTRDFGVKGYLYEGVIRDIASAFDAVAEETSVALAYEQWSRYLRYTYGRLETTKDLFCRHTYLTVLARFIVWAALPEKKESYRNHAELIGKLLDGSYFDEYGITNLVDRDFFYWVATDTARKKLTDTWLEVLNYLYAYDFDEIGEDLLKGVYQELVDPKDRHDLGEYYTPDWLCEEIIERLMEGVSGVPAMLDPTCGSGSFLRAGIANFIKNAEKRFGKKVNRGMMLDRILNNVCGIDIHPLAATISKANYVLGLKDILTSRRGPIEIPVYLADSLFSWAEKENGLFRGEAVKLDGTEYVFPKSVFAAKGLFDKLIIFAAETAERLAAGGAPETAASISNYLARAHGEITRDERELTSSVLLGLVEHLARKVEAGEDTIWSFILRNNYAPAFLREKFDVVFGNPPWIAFRTIAEPAYQEELRKLGIDRYHVAPKDQKLRTHMEIATIFLVHSTHTYLKDRGKLGFVMPRSVFSSDHHADFRKESFTAGCNVIEYWDLDKVRPLFKVPAAVIIAEKREPKRKKSYAARFYEGRLPEKDVPWHEAKEYLKVDRGKVWFSRLGGRTALTREHVETTGKSYYLERFRQGATIVPRNFYFIAEPTEDALKREVLYIKTDEQQAKTAKPPYKEVLFEGNVERSFLFRTAIAKHVLPFTLLDPAWIVIPVVKTDSSFLLKTADELLELGFRFVAEWFSRAEQKWQELRGAKADKQDLYERLNYHNELMNQNPIAENVVLYNMSGTNISCSFTGSARLGFPFYADAKTYRYYANSKGEAFYIIGVLNAPLVDEIIKPFQSRGLLGPRDIGKKVLEIPFPKFSSSVKLHEEIAGIAKTASKKAKAFVADTELPKSLGRTRVLVRESLAAELKDLDVLVRRLLKGIIE